MQYIQFSVLLLILTFFNSSNGFAQENKQVIHSDQPYLGQIPPSTTPELFAPGVISIEGRYEFGCSFSSDGTELFYGVDNNGIMEIHHTKVANGKWTAHKKLFKDSPFSHNDPMYSPDEKQLYFISNRPMLISEGAKDVDIWYIELDDDWSAPKNVGAPINSTLDEYFISFAKDGTMYYSSRNNAQNLPQNSFDIFEATKTKDGFAIPERLPNSINTN